MEPKNGYMFDPESPTEMARLITLDRAITASMGGALVGIPPRITLNNVLDVACGPGGWVLDAAFELPGVEVAGIDISRTMIDYANARARTQLLPNASFGVMDITQPLDFADGSFDLINIRFLVSVLQREQWSTLLADCLRLLRPGGLIRIVESDGFVISTSTSLTRLQHQLLRAMHQKGYGFSADDGYTLGITPVLSHLLIKAGFQPHPPLAFIFDLSRTSQYWADGYRLSEVTYKLAEQQGLLKDLPLAEGEEVEKVIDRMQFEMHMREFGALTYGAIVSGTKSPKF